MEEKKRKEVRRSNSYPSINITEAYELVEFIYKNSGNTFINLDDIAKMTNKSVGNMSQKIGSAVQYNLLELKSGTGYRATELFKKIYRPISDVEKDASLVECFKSPKLYNELIEKYENNPLPSEMVLPNILERDHSIYDEAAKKASQIFLNNVYKLQLINSHNELVLYKIDEDEEESQTYNNNNEEQKNSSVLPQISTDSLKIEIGLLNNRKAIIIYPQDLNKTDIEIMKLQLTVLDKLVEYKNPE